MADIFAAAVGDDSSDEGPAEAAVSAVSAVALVPQEVASVVSPVALGSGVAVVGGAAASKTPQRPGDHEADDDQGGGGAGIARPGDHEADDDLFGRNSSESEPGDAGPGDAAAGGSGAIAPCGDAGVVGGVSVEAAREVLIADARQKRDETSLRRLLRQRDESKQHEKDAATPVALALQNLASARQGEWLEKRRQAKEAERQGRLDVEVAAQRKAEALVRHEELRLQNTQENMRWRREELARRQELLLWKAQQKWYQTEYPCALASQLVRKIGSKSPQARTDFVKMLKGMAAQNWFRFIPRLPMLWDPDKNFLVRCGEVRPFDGHVPRSVRCAAVFDAYLDEIAPPGLGKELKDPVVALQNLLESVAPGSPRHVFQGPRTFLRFLHLNDYILDKTFVCCVVCLSKWLRPENWADGVFDWPPPVPPDALPVQPAPSLVEDEPAPLADGAAASLGDLSPRSRPSFPAMSSSGAL